MSSTPPPRLGSDPANRRPSNLWGLAGLLALALIAAHVIELWQVPLPRCTTRSLTGVPCPFCGSTRTLMAAARGDLATAAALNPLVFIGLLAIPVWLVALALERLAGRPLLPLSLARWHRVRWGWVLTVVLLANWFYLWRTLPP
ncbi:MAG: DUF2752 domain-containing protein [Verrucomicrobia bacterium]|nr:DUF2752 domain-containing protein [Verrucomicrobiota bacterium]